MVTIYQQLFSIHLKKKKKTPTTTTKDQSTNNRYLFCVFCDWSNPKATKSMTTMTGQQYYCKIWLLIVVVWFSSRSVLSLPMQLSILHREKECLFEYVERE